MSHSATKLLALEVNDGIKANARVTIDLLSAGSNHDSAAAPQEIQQDSIATTKTVGDPASGTGQDSSHDQMALPSSRTTTTMEDLDRIAEIARRLPTEGEKQRKMNMIYSRRKRLRAKERDEQLEQQCVDISRANEMLRVENARLEAILTNAMQQIILANNQQPPLLWQDTASLNSQPDSSLQTEQTSINRTASLTPASGCATTHPAFWMQQQQLEQRLSQLHHRRLLLETMIGQAPMDESSLSSKRNSESNLARSTSTLGQQGHVSLTSQGNSSKHALIWQQILQQQQRQGDSNAAIGLSAIIPPGLDQQVLPKLEEYDLQQPPALQRQHAILPFQQPLQVMQPMNDEIKDGKDQQNLLIELVRRRREQLADGEGDDY
jgi:hypothetical protein